MKRISTASGFTIIELVVVISVIGILAAIAVVSYAGVRDRAKAEDAKVNALSTQKVAEAYYSRHNVYPSSAAHFSSTHVTFPSNIILMRAGESYTSEGANTAIDQKAREQTVSYKFVRSSPSGPATGACLYYWDFTTDSRSEVTYLGTANSSNCGHALHLGSGLPLDP